MTNSKELFSEVVKRISLPEEKAEIESIAYLLLEKKWKLSRTDILAEKITPVLWRDVEPYIARINTHEPIQYILGEADFFGRVFQVTPEVLIPRPETELLVQEIIRHVKSIDQPALLDIGTGSGCIAISLALETRCTMHAVDVRVAALQVAAQNATRLQANVKFYELDILKERLDKKFDLIVSNPPYISQQEKHHMKPNVLNYEPHTALFALGDDPLLFYRAITRQAQHALNRGGSLWFEINEHYAKEICEIMKTSGFENATVVKDWDGKERVVWGNR
ncbi:MAG: peptide chain release factor N(5)-glutamine methyltransferase [Bacteroidetes bacterium CHB5]|nr:peptide chain release factor N(5)-glutamine methyltransferase [Bacteroidetes bacterium CHB5]